MSLPQRAMLSLGVAVVGCLLIIIGWRADDARWRKEYAAKAKKDPPSAPIDAPRDIVDSTRASLGDGETIVSVQVDAMLVEALRPEGGGRVDVYATRTRGGEPELAVSAARVVYVSRAGEKAEDRGNRTWTEIPVTLVVPRERALELVAANHFGEVALELAATPKGDE